jgi:tetratricopeptide (TPR) repeat protein
MSNSRSAMLPLRVVAGYGKKIRARSAVARAGRAALIKPRTASRPVKRADRAERAERLRVREELERVVASEDFDASRRSRDLLRFVVEETLLGRGVALTQALIATRVFDRREDFDALVDPIVRIQAGRLRRSLERYYLLSGGGDPLRIELPRGTYVPVFRTLAEREPASIRQPDAPSAILAAEWPSVAVSLFEPAAPGSEQREAAARLNETLVLELGRYPDVQALLPSELDEQGPSPRERARLSLGGRIREEDGGLRVTARLVDHGTGAQVWGDEYHTGARAALWSGTLDDIARVVAARVGGEEGVVVQLAATEHRKLGSAPSTPYRAILLSYRFLLACDSSGFAAALHALRQVVVEQPECGLAWTALAHLCLTNHAFEATEIRTPIDEAIAYAQRAVRVDPASRRARAVLAAALLIKGELAAARHELDDALRVSPDSLVYLEIIGCQLSLLGDGERGPALIRTARRRNPHRLPQGSFGLWFDHLRRGQLELAHEKALEYRDPTFFWRAVMRGCCLAHLGRRAEAEAEVAEILRQKPDFKARGRTLLGHYLKLPEVASRVVDGLALAGLTLD